MIDVDATAFVVIVLVAAGSAVIVALLAPRTRPAPDFPPRTASARSGCSCRKAFRSPARCGARRRRPPGPIPEQREEEPVGMTALLAGHDEAATLFPPVSLFRLSSYRQREPRAGARILPAGPPLPASLRSAGESRNVVPRAAGDGRETQKMQ
jgi:hypothetical protein